ncbi:MAG: cell division protein FtsQ/DivIB [Blastocatellia bacterium]
MAAARNRRTEPPFETEQLPPEEVAAGGQGSEGAAPERPRRRRTSKARSAEGVAAPGKRRQLKLPFVKSEVTTRRAAKVGGGVLLFVVLIVGIFLAYHLFAGSRFFALNGVDVEGNVLLSATEVEAMVRASVPSGVLNADLAQIRDKLQGFPLIRQAKVVRLLPDRLRVTISERTPIAVARLADGATACMDEEGALFGNQDTWRGKPMPPLINGVAESGDRKNDINRQLVLTYKRLIEELDQNEPPLSSRIDEVTFDPDQGVRVTLANSRIVVLLGRNDFRARLNAALDVIEAVNRRDSERLIIMRISDAERLLSGIPIKYLNVTDPSRVVVGLEE